MKPLAFMNHQRVARWFFVLASLMLVALVALAQTEAAQTISPDNAAEVAEHQVIGEHRDAITQLRFFNEPYNVITSSRDNSWRTWDARSGDRSGLVNNTLGSGITAFGVNVADRDVMTATGVIQRGTGRVVVSSPDAILVLPAHDEIATAAEVSAGNRYVATAGGDDTVKLWSTENGDLLYTWETDALPTRLAFDSAGAKLYAAAGEHFFQYDVETGEMDELFSAEGTVVTDFALVEAGDGVVEFIVALNVGAVIDSVYADSPLSINMEVTAIDVNPAGDILAVATTTGEVYLMDRELGEVLNTLKAGNSPLDHIAFSPDGLWLAAGGELGVVTVWGIPLGNE